MKNNYDRTSFEMGFLNDSDVVKVNKSAGSTTTYIIIADQYEIQLRQLEAVESLYFMLGKLLEKSEG